MLSTFLIVALCTFAGSQTQSQSLGDYARSVRKKNTQDTKAAKVFDNDNLPNSTINTVGTTSKTDAAPAKDQDASKPADANPEDKSADPNSQPNAKDKNPSDQKSQDGADAKKKPSDEIKPGQSLEDRRAAYDVWRKRIDEQKQKVDQLARDLDDFQHHALMPQVDDWTANVKYKQGIIDRQKALDAARTELSDLQDKARRSGVPASVAE